MTPPMQIRTWKSGSTAGLPRINLPATSDCSELDHLHEPQQVGDGDSMKSIAIIGAGGCARELAWLIEDISAATSDEASRYTLVGFLVSDANRLGPYDSPTLGDFT